MLTDPPSGALDLLVVGGLTIDRFADGSSVPGGSVIHIARAAGSRDVRVGVATAAGSESEAALGLAEIRRLAAQVEVTPQAATTTFRHRESSEGRRLWLEQRGAAIALGSDARDRFSTRAILYAPVAGEFDPDALVVWDDIWTRCAILQGWLRAAAEGGEVEPLRLSTLPSPLRDALATMNLIVASREDLLAEAPSPFEQLTAMRMAFGRAPVLVVTDGADGMWLDSSGARPNLDRRHHLIVPWVVEGAPTVGAGDILAGFLTIGWRYPGQRWRAPFESAMRVVAEVLDERKGG